MKAMTVYLLPHSSFRGSRPLRSDTLFGAICWGYRLLFGEDKLLDVLEEFEQHPVPFLISSLFTYEVDQGKIHYLPKPLADPYRPEKFASDKPSLQELEALKSVNKKPIVTDSEFTKIIRGEMGDKDFYEEILHGSERERKPDIKNVQIPHSAINRLTGSVEGPRFFYTEECLSSSDSGDQVGLFFCVKCREGFENDLKTIFRFLADKGIGGGASVGKGHIKSIEIVDNYLPYTEPEEETEHVLTLSLTFPDDSIRPILSKCWYELEKRQGKIESMYVQPGHIWKDHLILLKEGSTFPKNERTYYGANKVVRKDDGNLGFDVQHYGYAFTVKTKHAL